MERCFYKIKEWREITLSYEYYENTDEVEMIFVEGEIEIEDVDLIYKQIEQLFSMYPEWDFESET